MKIMRFLQMESIRQLGYSQVCDALLPGKGINSADPSQFPSEEIGVDGRGKDLRMWLDKAWQHLIAVNVHDEEKVRMGRLFNTLMVISIGIVTALTLVFVCMYPLGLITTSVSWEAAAFPFAFIPFSIYCIAQAKRGHIRPMIALYTWVNFVAISLAAFIFDGIRSPAWLLYIWTITIAGTMLAPGYALRMSGAAVVYFLVMLLFYHLGLYAPPLSFGPKGLDFVNLACLIIMLISTVGLLTYLNMRSLNDAMHHLKREITERLRVEKERGKLIQDLQEALAQVKVLSGLLPICSSCKKIRDKQGNWNAIENYIQGHSEAEFTHGLCPECMEKLYPDFSHD